MTADDRMYTCPMHPEIRQNAPGTCPTCGIALGTGTAYVYSVVGTLAPGLFPASFRTHGGDVGLYFEAAAVITVLVLLGQVLELRARSQTSSAIRSLLHLAPPTARRLRPNGTEEDAPL